MPRKTTNEEIITTDTVTSEAVEVATDTAQTTPEVSPPAALPDSSEAPAGKASLTRKAAPSSILTLSADAEVETQESKEDLIWHELQNAYRTKKILTGNLGGIERMDGGGTIAVIYYCKKRQWKYQQSKPWQVQNSRQICRHCYRHP